MQSKTIKCKEVESRIIIIRGWRVKDWGDDGQMFQYIEHVCNSGTDWED
jgi:hypothetical protein